MHTRVLQQSELSMHPASSLFRHLEHSFLTHFNEEQQSVGNEHSSPSGKQSTQPQSFRQNPPQHSELSLQKTSFSKQGLHSLLTQARPLQQSLLDEQPWSISAQHRFCSLHLSPSQQRHFGGSQNLFKFSHGSGVGVGVGVAQCVGVGETDGVAEGVFSGISDTETHSQS